ncbi:MAG: translation initiation factor IF-3 [Acidimicrobiia bacterium]
MNGYIRSPEVRVVAPDGAQIGVVKLQEALYLADQLGLDLVEVAPEARPPVCRLMDYGKWKYEQSVRDREARKKQTRTVIKELRFRPRIGDHDFQIQRRKAEEFLAEGGKVKVTVRFRGREHERPEFGRRLLDRLAEEVGELATIEQPAALEGRNMVMVLAPTRKPGRRGQPRVQSAQADQDGPAVEAAEAAEDGPAVEAAEAAEDGPAVEAEAAEAEDDTRR